MQKTNFLAVDINISMDKMLDTGWLLMKKYFEKYELGIKEELTNKYWDNHKSINA